MANRNSTPYQKITEQIIATLEECDANGWEMPWRQLGGSLAANAISYKNYRGINRLILGMATYKQGYSDSRWVLLDYGSIMIHLFDAETREYYDLENLWGLAENVELPAEVARADIKPDAEQSRLHGLDAAGGGAHEAQRGFGTSATLPTLPRSRYASAPSRRGAHAANGMSDKFDGKARKETLCVGRRRPPGLHRLPRPGVGSAGP